MKPYPTSTGIAIYSLPSSWMTAWPPVSSVNTSDPVLLTRRSQHLKAPGPHTQYHLGARRLHNHILELAGKGVVNTDLKAGVDTILTIPAAKMPIFALQYMPALNLRPKERSTEVAGHHHNHIPQVHLLDDF